MIAAEKIHSHETEFPPDFMADWLPGNWFDNSSCQTEGWKSRWNPAEIFPCQASHCNQYCSPF